MESGNYFITNLTLKNHFGQEKCSLDRIIWNYDQDIDMDLENIFMKAIFLHVLEIDK